MAGLGTSGTFVGAGRRLREVNPAIRLISVQPDSPLHGLEGLKHMETAIVPGIYDPALADEDLGVEHRGGVRADRGSWRGRAVRRDLERREPGRRAATWRGGRQDAVIVVVFCDGGEKYLSERFWDEGDGAPTGARADGARARGRRRRRRSARTASKPIRTSAAARSIGRDGVVTATFALPNTTEEGPAAAVSGAAAGLPRGRAAGDATLGAELLGFYHSHPDHPARPSQYDLDHAWPFFSYIIVSVRAGVPEDMTSWRLREDRSAFDQEDLTHA